MSMRRALLFAYAEKYGSYVIALASTVVISRLLSPADVGAFAVAMALVGVVAVLREFGVSTYLVQETDLDARRVAAAFTLTIGIGSALGLVVALLAVPTASFYGDPRLRDILWILALSFALTPLGSVSQSLLTREMRFDVLAWVRLAHGAVAGGVGVLLAWLGYGPLSLAWAALCATIVNAVLSMVARPHPLRLNVNRADLARVVAVGLPATLVSIVDDLINTIPDLVVGRWQGLAAAGLLSRARGLSQMAHQLIARAANPVFFAVFSERRRDGAEVEQLYVKATSCVCAVGWVLLVPLAVLADPVVRVLFGAQWGEVAVLLRWLCASAAVLLLTSGAHMLLLSHHGAGDALRARLWALPWYLGCGVAGAMISVRVMAAVTVVASVMATAFMAMAVRKRVGIGLRRQLEPLRSALPALGAGTAAAPAAFWYAASNTSSWLALATGGLCAALGAVSSLAIGRSPLRAEILKLWRMRAIAG
jgi:O-antigen/teichoic acid export membrane protein